MWCKKIQKSELNPNVQSFRPKRATATDARAKISAITEHELEEIWTIIIWIKQISKIDILYNSWYSRKKNKKTTDSVIFRLYSKDIVKQID